MGCNTRKGSDDLMYHVLCIRRVSIEAHSSFHLHEIMRRSFSNSSCQVAQISATFPKRLQKQELRALRLKDSREEQWFHPGYCQLLLLTFHRHSTREFLDRRTSQTLRLAFRSWTSGQWQKGGGSATIPNTVTSSALGNCRLMPAADLQGHGNAGNDRRDHC